MDKIIKTSNFNVCDAQKSIHHFTVLIIDFGNMLLVASVCHMINTEVVVMWFGHYNKIALHPTEFPGSLRKKASHLVSYKCIFL